LLHPEPDKEKRHPADAGRFPSSPALGADMLQRPFARIIKFLQSYTQPKVELAIKNVLNG
jgi:hypothetical protein